LFLQKARRKRAQDAGADLIASRRLKPFHSAESEGWTDLDKAKLRKTVTVANGPENRRIYAWAPKAVLVLDGDKFFSIPAIQRYLNRRYYRSRRCVSPRIYFRLLKGWDVEKTSKFSSSGFGD